MSRSRSRSRETLDPSSLNRPNGFRTIHRDRSNHELVNETKKPTDDIAKPTQSRLERLLSISPSQPQYNGRPYSLTEKRKNGALDQSALLRRSRNLQSHLSQKSTSNLSRLIESQKAKMFESSSLDGEQLSSRQNSRIISSLSRLKNNEEKPLSSRLISQRDQTDLGEIDFKLNELINKKLSLMKDRLSGSTSNPDFLSNYLAIEEQLKQLFLKITKIKEAKESSLQEGLVGNKKIEYIEKLLAENMTEVELLKKFYLGTTSKRLKNISPSSKLPQNKVLKAFDTLTLSEKERRQSKKLTELTPKKSPKQLFYQETIQKETFRSPNPEDYESFRFKPQPFSLNLQPLPRSSYKRDYLMLRSEPCEAVVLPDNSAVFPKYFYELTSMYSKDFPKRKTEIVNHKQLDAYQNKLRFINVSYMPKKRSQTMTKKKEKAINYNRDNGQACKLPSAVKAQIKGTQAQSRFSKKMMMSEAKKQFVWGTSPEKSRIKHQQLRQFQYRLKNMYKA